MSVYPTYKLTLRSVDVPFRNSHLYLGCRSTEGGKVGGTENFSLGGGGMHLWWVPGDAWGGPYQHFLPNQPFRRGTDPELSTRVGRLWWASEEGPSARDCRKGNGWSPWEERSTNPEGPGTFYDDSLRRKSPSSPVNYTSSFSPLGILDLVLESSLEPRAENTMSTPLTTVSPLPFT